MIVVADVSAVMEILFRKDKKDLFSGRIEGASWVIAPVFMFQRVQMLD